MKKITLKKLDALGIQQLSAENLRTITGGASGAKGPCPIYLFECNDGTCIEPSKINDGHNDCKDGEDEFPL
ncbi:low-density lipoprotein receptor class A repeat-containing protein [Chitinophaga sp. HK235]|uniref:low-density lipoprotein receptor class A repeat-containing protein n=1 Tax=Chitinophaga sp. HK235 TaxID=2952571 RepID=UPI001BAB9C22|nr:low-density lipoprotein receptor class A repeat-containing protein [Chitinophaga sp. HK235]